MNFDRIREISQSSKSERWPFPKTFETLREAGVASYRFDVARGTTSFFGMDGGSFSESLQVTEVPVSLGLDPTALRAAIEEHIAQQTPFSDFRLKAAAAGVEYWNVDMERRTVAYAGLDGRTHLEIVPGKAND